MDSDPATCATGHLGGHAVYIGPGPPNIDDLSVSAPALNEVRRLRQTRGSTGSEGVLGTDMGWHHFERLNRTSTSSSIARQRLTVGATYYRWHARRGACHLGFTKNNVSPGKKVTPIPENCGRDTTLGYRGPGNRTYAARSRQEYGWCGALDCLSSANP